MGDISVFQRVEKKYRMTRRQCERFLETAEGRIHGDEYGLHTIHNIYYDTEQYGLIRNSIEKPKYKEKFRLRGYGEIREDSGVFLEIKKKYQGVVYKRRTCLPYRDAMLCLEHGIMPKQYDQVMREIAYFMEFYNPGPRVYLAYDRRAYVGNEDPELRITIDRNIRGRYDKLELGYDGECRLIEPDNFLMEIKVPAAYPLWLADILSELEIYPVSFSKYGAIYAAAVLSGELQFGNKKIQTTSERIQNREEEELCLQAYSTV